MGLTKQEMRRAAQTNLHNLIRLDKSVLLAYKFISEGFDPEQDVLEGTVYAITVKYDTTALWPHHAAYEVYEFFFPRHTKNEMHRCRAAHTSSGDRDDWYRINLYEEAVRNTDE